MDDHPYSKNPSFQFHHLRFHTNKNQQCDSFHILCRYDTAFPTQYSVAMYLCRLCSCKRGFCFIFIYFHIISSSFEIDFDNNSFLRKREEEAKHRKKVKKVTKNPTLEIYKRF